MSRRARILLSITLAVVAATVLAFVVGDLSPEQPTSRQLRTGRLESLPHFPIPPLTPTRYLNASPEARYVGSATCARCHPDQHATYLQTGHSRALSEVDPAAEPPDAEFHHAASGRWYRVYRSRGELRHREIIKTGGGAGKHGKNPATGTASDPDAASVPVADNHRRDGEELVLADYALKYLVGSGRHSRTYLIEDDGFLAESPVTWYASKNAWHLSPGYDQPFHAGFERGIDVGCLHCHAGRVEPLGKALEKLRIHEQVIGCESCHGPGSLHVERWRPDDAPDLKPGESDLTIVHPAELSRSRREDLCAQCHLRSAATVVVRGRSLLDFRPGRKLSDYRIDYALQTTNHQSSIDDHQSMKVVGHVEQMRLSRCYTHSASLTCTTCHNPHATPAESKRMAWYRGKCLTCHAGDDCGLDHAVRLKKSAADNCVSCHMPQVPTDLPHIAFTHHRIGVHGEGRDQGTGDRRQETGVRRQESGSRGQETELVDRGSTIEDREPSSQVTTDNGQRTTDNGQPSTLDPQPDHHSPLTTHHSPILLVPIEENRQLSAADSARNLGLAYLEAADRQPPPLSTICRRRAAESLGEAYSLGLRDGDLLAALARLAWEQEQDSRAYELARAAMAAAQSPETSVPDAASGHRTKSGPDASESRVQSPEPESFGREAAPSGPRLLTLDSGLSAALSPKSRVNCLVLLADLELRRGRAAQAVAYARQLTRTRRQSGDWLLLARSHLAAGNAEQARQALRRAARIGAHRPDVAAQLAAIYQQLGEVLTARQHAARIPLLEPPATVR